MTKKASQSNLFNPELLDEILKSYKNPEDMFGKDGILKQPQKVYNLLVKIGLDDGVHLKVKVYTAAN